MTNAELQELFDAIDASTPAVGTSVPTSTVWNAVEPSRHRDWELWNLIPGALSEEWGTNVLYAASGDGEPEAVPAPPWLSVPEVVFDLTAVIRNMQTGEEYAFSI